jgi:hypothetical protein
MDDLSNVCTRQPQEGDAPGETCPDCPHPVGCHGGEACPLCVIISAAGAITAVIGAHAAAFTGEVAASMAGALGDYAGLLASVVPSLEAALAPEAPE